MENIKLEYREQIALLTISRPKQHNALNLATIWELGQAFDEMAGREDLRAVIVTGEGERAFVAGADTRELESLDEAGALALSQDGNRVYYKIQRFPAPVIAAVNGFALGGGMELALSCDIRIASENALFGLPETGLGVTPGWGGTQRLSRLVGYGLAAEMVFTAGRISAQRALEIGLVSAVVAPDMLPETAMGLAGKIAANAPLAVRAAKRVMLEGLEVRLEEGTKLEGQEFSRLYGSDDTRKGLIAFNKKERYAYTGR